MKVVRGVLVMFWWLTAGYIPIAQARFYRRYADSIGCPPNGGCYVDGSEHLLGMELLVFGSALVLWPACFWVLVARPLRSAYRRRADSSAAVSKS
jgi:hypothetical protein